MEASETPIRMRMGLHTCNLMTGVIGDDDRHQPGLISYEFTTASRIEGLTKIFEAGILLSESTIGKIPNTAAYPHRYLDSVKIMEKITVVCVDDRYGGNMKTVQALISDTPEDLTLGLAAYLNTDFIGAAAHLVRVHGINPGNITADRHFRHMAERLLMGMGPARNDVEIMPE